ncbi:MAG: flagellar basal body rod protein FlgB [Curvibacter sp.]|nr:flagellar basal body rod protein FlgB [Curvibacter sp.]
MLDKFTANLNFQSQALQLRSERQRTIASNIANADTPGYVGRDFNFAQALQNASGNSQSMALTASSSGTSSTGTEAGFIPLPSFQSTTSLQQGYTEASQPNLDSNTVDMDRERANFADNSVRYEATLRFITADVKTMLSAIQGQ